jgi:hypothetical protein
MNLPHPGKADRAAARTTAIAAIATGWAGAE